ncbi:hypothetical protein [Methylopila turkensis]|uniref:Uncharacterized protein n=1 Tax=Methylopila turkensis TaxID=1437816 RepID=A0A9W6JP30_9HYPH|nr:hypothetical protein [Methylopila turkensis]GLK79788.1 hypothetical protein GCM10008174_15290 [Methylopila turkensis]
MTEKPSGGGGYYAVNTNDGRTTTYFNGALIQSYSQETQSLTTFRPVKPTDPSKLIGPKLKVERAKRHIAELANLAADFATRNAYELTHDIDPQTGENVFRMLVHEPIPRDVSSIAGDAVHNLRTALDYLVCDLVRANGKTPHQNGGFPIEARAKRSKPGTISKIQGVRASAEKLILRIKACEGINAALFRLNILDVFDKHNGIVAVAAATVQLSARVEVPGVFIGPNGTFCIGGGLASLMIDAGTPTQFRKICPLENDVEIHRSPGEFREEIQASIAISFGKTSIIDIEGEPIIETLELVTNIVERIIGMFERRAF